MHTTVDIDATLLRQAEEQAKKQGKSLDTLLEEALRTVVEPPTKIEPGQQNDSFAQGLESDDAFFAALDEIRANGRRFAPHR